MLEYHYNSGEIEKLENDFPEVYKEILDLKKNLGKTFFPRVHIKGLIISPEEKQKIKEGFVPSENFTPFDTHKRFDAIWHYSEVVESFYSFYKKWDTTTNLPVLYGINVYF